MQCIKCKTDLPEGAIYCYICGAKQIREYSKKKRGNGQGTVYKRGNSWEARITHYVNGTRRTQTKCGFSTKKAALDWLSSDRKTKGTVTLASLYNDYCESSMLKLSASKQTAYKIAFGRIEKIAYIPIGDLSISDLQSCITGLTYYPAKDVKTVLSHLYKRACAQQDALSNLSSYIELPELEEEEPEPFSEDEIRKLWAAFENNDIIAGEALVMIYTGAMPGELINCKKEMIDFDAQKIIGAGMKTKERKKRSILLPDIIVPVLQTICDSHNYKSVVGINRDNWYKEYHAMTERVGIRDLPPYSCRHTTATALALGDNVAPVLIKKIMRQKRAVTTERYKHANEQQLLDALNTLGKESITNKLQTNVEN